MEELMQVIKCSLALAWCDNVLQLDREDGQLPLLLSLASEERSAYMMENLELVADPAMLVRAIQVLEQEEVELTWNLVNHEFLGGRVQGFPKQPCFGEELGEQIQRKVEPFCWSWMTCDT